MFELAIVAVVAVMVWVVMARLFDNGADEIVLNKVKTQAIKSGSQLIKAEVNSGISNSKSLEKARNADGYASNKDASKLLKQISNKGVTDA